MYIYLLCIYYSVYVINKNEIKFFYYKSIKQ